MFGVFKDGLYLIWLEAGMQDAALSTDNRPEHQMRDHESLKDACCFLQIAAEACPNHRVAIVRLLFSLVRSNYF